MSNRSNAEHYIVRDSPQKGNTPNHLLLHKDYLIPL
jgi:hypothetical protein